MDENFLSILNMMYIRWLVKHIGILSGKRVHILTVSVIFPVDSS